MSPRRTGAVALKVLRTLKHDRRSLGLMVVAPTLAMVIFGVVFATEVHDVPVAVVVEDEGDLAARVVANFDPEVVAVRHVASWEEARRMVESGEAAAALRFPSNFTADAMPSPGPPPRAPHGSVVTAYVDGSNSQYVQAVQRELLEAVQEALGEGGGRAPVAAETEYAFAEGARYIDYFVPGIMTFGVFMFTTLLTILAFVGERASGTLQRLLATPIREAELVLGYALAFSVIGLVQGAAILAVALLAFDAMNVGSTALVFLVMSLTAVVTLSLGILISAAATREAQAVQLFPLIAFPVFLLSGIFVPTESLPAWLHPLAYAVPPTYAAEALRAVMLRGEGLDAVWRELAALVAFAVVFLAAAVAGLKRSRALAA